MRRTTLAPCGLLFLLLGACDVEPTSRVPSAPAEADAVELAAFASFGADGRRVQFFDVDGTIEIGVLTKYPAAPLVPEEIIEQYNAAEVYLALAADGAELPTQIAGHFTQEEVFQMTGIEAVSRVRSDLEEARARQPSFEAESDIPDNAIAAAVGCTNSFRNWVNGVYGGSECGHANVGFHDDNVSTTYCKSGCPGKIYFYGGAGDCKSSLNKCSNQTFGGSAKNTNFRVRDSWGNTEMIKSGFRSHFAAANCSGNGSFTFKRKYGSGSWKNKSVPINHMYHYYSGKPLTQQGPALYGLFYGNYKDSSSQYVHRMKIDKNTGSNDRGIFCGDVLHSFTGSAPPAYSCGGCAWCSSGSPCNGCFKTCTGN